MFHKNNVCHTESLCLRQNGQKRSVFDDFTFFDIFWPFLTDFFWNTVTQCDKVLKKLNTVTELDKLFSSLTQWISVTNIYFRHSDLFSGKFIFSKKLKFCLPFKNKFQHRRKIGLEHLLSTLHSNMLSNNILELGRKKFFIGKASSVSHFAVCVECLH